MNKVVKKVRVESADLVVGMFVCDLDRPWLDSPFLIQGFYIKDRRDVETVCGVCDYVFVDKVVRREQLTSSLPGASSAVLLPAGVNRPGVRLSRAAEEKQRKQSAKSEQGIEYFFPNKELVKYTDTLGWRDETRHAKRAIKYLYDFTVRFMQLSVKSDRLDLQNVQKAVQPMVDSVIRNPDACLWWTAMKPAANDNHDSSLRSSVYATVLGRQLGLPANDLCSLAIGGLLFDIGKLRLDDSILNADRRLTAEEMAIMQRHIETGLDLLKRSGLTDANIIDVIANHHERLDGSGYPQGLGGNLIPAFGRIAGVVDCYNAMTSSRRYANTRSPAEAINQLYKLQGVHFHTDLIKEFIHAIGVYPVGALVELSTGEVAIVVAQSRARRLRPTVLVLLDGNKNRTPGGNFIVLEEAMHSDDGSKLDIVRNLEPNTLGLDRDAIRLSF